MELEVSGEVCAPALPTSPRDMNLNHTHESIKEEEESTLGDKKPEEGKDYKIRRSNQESPSYDVMPHVIHIAKDSLAVHTSYEEVNALQGYQEDQSNPGLDLSCPVNSSLNGACGSTVTNQLHGDSLKGESLCNEASNHSKTHCSGDSGSTQEIPFSFRTKKLKSHKMDCKCIKCTKKDKGEKSPLKSFQCGQCNQSFTASAFLVKHTKIHIDRERAPLEKKEHFEKLEGDVKDDVRTNGEALQNQEQIPENRKCEVCHKTFVDSTVLACHLRMHTHQMKYQHLETSPATEIKRLKKDNDATSTKDLTAQQPFQCDLCGKQFASSGLLSNHRRRHSTARPYHCSHCGKGFVFVGDLNKHVRSHTGEKPFQCSECGMKFALSGNLKKHLDSHSDIRPFQCNLCEKSFRRAAHLTVHVRTHSGEKPFHCNICNKSFSRETGLAMHQKIHLGHKSIQCQHCEKTFYCKSDLTKHQRTHTGEKPYTCEHCNKGFSQLGHLKIHRRTHTGEKPFRCTYCPSTFSSSQNLTKHRRKHTGLKPFECSQCGRKFAQKGNLQTHLRVHSDERPFKCNQCETSFKDPSSLVKHKKQLHTNLRPYVCAVCMKAFKRGSHLKKHKESVHKATGLELKHDINDGVVVSSTE